WWGSARPAARPREALGAQRGGPRPGRGAVPGPAGVGAGRVQAGAGGAGPPSVAQSVRPRAGKGSGPPRRTGRSAGRAAGGSGGGQRVQALDRGGHRVVGGGEGDPDVPGAARAVEVAGGGQDAVLGEEPDGAPR